MMGARRDTLQPSSDDKLPSTDYSHCPIRNVFSKFSDEWSMMVLCSIYQDESGLMDAEALSRQLPDCPPEMLKQTLMNLCAHHLLYSMDDTPRSLHGTEDTKKFSAYSLTDIGKSLMPKLMNLIEWAEERT